jgi:hypothetical protein
MRLLLLFAFTLPAAAQQAPVEPPKERPSLNLKLDRPSSFATVAPPEKSADKELPTLGGDARKPPPPSAISPKSDGLYPKDTNPTR